MSLSILCIKGKECEVCQRMTKKLDTGVPELNPVPVVSTWYHIGIDFIGPLKHKSTQGNCYILTVSDYFSKFVQAFACNNKKSSTVFSVLIEVLCTYLLCVVHGTFRQSKCTLHL